MFNILLFKKKFLRHKASRASENTFEPKGDYLYTWHVLDAVRFLEEDEKEIFLGNFCQNQRTRTEWQGIIINQKSIMWLTKDELGLLQ